MSLFRNIKSGFRDSFNSDVEGETLTTVKDECFEKTFEVSFYINNYRRNNLYFKHPSSLSMCFSVIRSGSVLTFCCTSKISLGFLMCRINVFTN